MLAKKTRLQHLSGFSSKMGVANSVVMTDMPRNVDLDQVKRMSVSMLCAVETCMRN